MVEWVLNLMQALWDKFFIVGSFIVNFFFRLGMTSLEFFFGWLRIPSFPEEWKGHIDSFFDLIFNNIGLLNFFIPLPLVLVLITIVRIGLTILITYKFVMWILRKLPFISIR